MMDMKAVEAAMDRQAALLDAHPEISMGRAIFDYVPRVLPWGWRETTRLEDGIRWRHRHGQSVIMSGQVQDGKRWIHLSLARMDRTPTHEELAEVKDIFLGRERLAIHLYPPRSKHVNLHPHCLHLWCCLDGDPVPDFTNGAATI